MYHKYILLSERLRSNSKSYLLYDLIYVTFIQMQILGTDIRPMIARAWKKMEGFVTQR